jgi:hypothetical protein
VKKLTIKFYLARANDVKISLKIVYLKHRNDVKFELNGFGENENKSPFENKTPRTILIERL